MKRVKLGKGGIVIFGIVAIIAIYLIFSLILIGRFLPRTTINGVSASFANPKSMAKRISKAAKDYSLKIETDGSVVGEIKGDSVDLDSDPENIEIQEFLASQNSFLWPVSIFKKTEFVGDEIVTFDSKKLTEEIKKLECMDNKKATKSEDAKYEFDGEEYVVVDEVYGNEVNSFKFTRETQKGIKSLASSLDLKKDDLYIKPNIKKDDQVLNDEVDRLNNHINTVISYEEGFEIAKPEISKWMSVDTGGNVTFDRELITEYVDGLAEKYDTYGKPKQLKTSYGNTVEVPGGNYGWKIDKEAEIEKIIEELESGENSTRSIEYKSKAASHGDNDYGNSYVEVNLSKQKLFLYINGSCVLDTDFVSGNLSKGHGTHTGAFQIAYCQKNAVLRGQDYETPVNFWMPFNMGEGLHDATWRKAFGGNIFRTSGSHGCVNLPYSAAKTIFGYVKAGFPVLVYSTGGTENTYTSVATAESVMSKIDGIGDPTIDKKGLIESIRNEYNSLPDDQKALVTNIGTLDWAESVIAGIEAQSNAEQGTSEQAKEKDEKEKAEKEKAEKEKAEKEKAEKEKAEKEKAEKEKAEKEKAEKEKAEKEKAEREKAEKEKAEREKAEQEKAENEAANPEGEQ